MNWTRYWTAGAMLVALSFGATGCEKKEKSPLEKAGESVENAMDDAADAIEDAGDKIKDATKDE